MIYQTTSEGIRIFKTAIQIEHVDFLISIVDDIQSDGFDCTKTYSYSLDDSRYSEEFSSIEMMILDIKSNQLLGLLEHFKIYLKFKYSITKNSTLAEYSTWKLESIIINDDFNVVDFNMEIGQMLENTIFRTDTNRTLNPYKHNDNAKNLYNELAIGINKMFGFDMIYFRTEPDIESRSVTFKAYELHNVVETKKLQISIKDNEIPENLEKFSELGFDFQNELVIHIVKHEFEKTFGVGKKPNSNDFIYFPLTDRMYQLNSPFDPKTFMQYAPFWEVMTTKYDARSSVKGRNSDENFHKVDEMIDFSDDYLRDEEELEQEDAVKDYAKPDQLSKLNDKHIVSNEEPVQLDLSTIYSISTMKASSGETVINYPFYQSYKDKLLATMWLKIDSSTTSIFTIKAEDSVDGIFLKSENGKFKLTIQNSNIVDKFISTPVILNKFIGIVLAFNEETFELDFMIIDQKKVVLFEKSINIAKFIQPLDHISFFGKLHYGVLRLCKNVEKYSYEDLLFNDMMPLKKDFVVIKNATPTLTQTY